MTQRVTVAFGDGIGPEIMTAALSVLDAAGAVLAVTNMTFEPRGWSTRSGRLNRAVCRLR